MTHKERVLSAVSHKKTDRVSLDYFADKTLTENLIKRLGVKDREELLQYFDIDVRWIEPFFANGKARLFDDGKYGNCFGIRTVEHINPDGSRFLEFLEPPLAKKQSPGEILEYEWPDESFIQLYDYAAQLEQYAQYATLTGPWCPVFNQSQHMRGTEQLFIDMAESPEIVKAIADNIVKFNLLQAEAQFSAMKGKCDIFYTGDDFACQRGTLMSIDMFKEFYFEPYKKLFGLAKDFGLKVMMHSCGAVSGLIPLFIEAGADIVDPIQVRAAGMDISVLKNAYRNVITFHGAIDQQHLLPFGRAEEVRQEVRDTINILGVGGGYILCSSHEFQTDTPLDNILTMYDEAKK